MTCCTNVKMEGEQLGLQPKRRYRLILDFKCQFPEKLYDVANDGHLVHWNRNGSVSVTSEEEFEQNVMDWYPGFLQISSFLNFKRLFREYGFDRDIGQNGNIEWSHPLFVRGRRDFVKEIKTRRKSFRNPKRDPVGTADSVIIPTEKHRRYSVRQRKKTQYFRPDEKPTTVDIGGGGDQHEDNKIVKNSYVIKPPQTIIIEENALGTPTDLQSCQKSNNSSQYGPQVYTKEMSQNGTSVAKNFNPKKIMDSFAEKEFNEDEYRQWIAKKRKFDEEKMKADKDVMSPKENEKKSSEFWWMYENKTGGEIVQTVNLSTRQTTGQPGETCTPCGFCKCCSAISNYVHLFGEIPENIQVIDYLEEVVHSQENLPNTPKEEIDNTTYLDVSEVTVVDTQEGENTETDEINEIQLGVEETAALDLIESISNEDIESIRTEINLPGCSSDATTTTATSNYRRHETVKTNQGNLAALAMAVSAVENKDLESAAFKQFLVR